MSGTRQMSSTATTAQPSGSLQFRNPPFSTSPTMTLSMHPMATFPQLSPTSERRTQDFGAAAAPRLQLSTSDPAQHQNGSSSSSTNMPAVRVHNLPHGTSEKDVRGIFLFSQSYLDVISVSASTRDPRTYSALVIFTKEEGPPEAQRALDGKLNAAGDLPMKVEILRNGYQYGQRENEVAESSRFNRRGTMDAAAAPRNQSNSASSNGSGNEPLPRRASRYNSTFQATDGISPPLATPGHGGELPNPEANSHFQQFFSPRSPVTHNARDRQQNLGRSIINDDVADEDTDGLIRNPLAFAMNGQASFAGSRGGEDQLPAQLRNLSFAGPSFENPGPSGSAVTSPSGAPLRQDYVGGGYGQRYNNGNGNGNGFQTTNSPPRTSYPPANPADQNPPCNTLYVGNLPNNTSEDELKRLFSSQRGYKRLCFRTKANGPMCFVEFESVTLATQALHHLYGKCLSNSIKGGIRLSFSKNPLGVRNGQGGMLPHPSMGNQGPPPGFGNGSPAPPGFTTATGPPPGLSNPSSARAPAYAPSFMPEIDFRAGGFGGNSMNSPFASQLSAHQNHAGYQSPHHMNHMNHMSGYAPTHSGGGMR